MGNVNYTLKESVTVADLSADGVTITKGDNKASHYLIDKIAANKTRIYTKEEPTNNNVTFTSADETITITITITNTSTINERDLFEPAPN